MENPHEEKQAVLLERIIKNVVSEHLIPVPNTRADPSITGEMQRKHRGTQPVFRRDHSVQRGLGHFGLVPELLA